MRSVFGIGSAIARELVARQRGGKLLAVGLSKVGVRNFIVNSFALAQYLPDGTLDTSLAEGTAKSLPTFPRGYSYAQAVALEEDGSRREHSNRVQQHARPISGCLRNSLLPA